MSLKSKMLLGAGAAVAGSVALKYYLHNKRFLDLRDRVCVITGGSRGLGLAIARELARQGAKLALLARDPMELELARTELEARFTHSSGGLQDLFICVCDISDQAQVNDAMGKVREHFGRIDALLNVAGIISVGPFETMTLEDYEYAMRTHFYGPLYTMMAVLPEMEQRREGRIANISSIGGKVAAPHLVPYTASKFALTGLSEGLRAELVKYNIFVTTVIPGLMQTGSPRHASFKGDSQAEYSWFTIADNLPGLSVSAEDMAEKVVHAMQHGDPELIYPLAANVGAKFHGLFPGLSSELASLIEQVLPQGGERTPRKGKELQPGKVPSFFINRDELNASSHNENASMA